MGDSVVKQFNCNSPLLLPGSTLSHPGMHHYRNHFMLQWYLLSHRAKNKWGDCYVELSHEYIHVLAHTQHTVRVSWGLSGFFSFFLICIIEADNTMMARMSPLLVAVLKLFIF